MLVIRQIFLVYGSCLWAIRIIDQNINLIRLKIMCYLLFVRFVIIVVHQDILMHLPFGSIKTFTGTL